MSKRLSRRALLESGGLAIGVLIARGATSRAVADEEIKEGPAALPDLPAIRATRQVQDRAGADLSAGLVPVLRGPRERPLIPPIVIPAQAGIQRFQSPALDSRFRARVCTHLIGGVVFVALAREKSSGLMRIPVVPAKAGTQDFSRLPLGPRVRGDDESCQSGGYSDCFFRGRPLTHRDVCMP